MAIAGLPEPWNPIGMGAYNGGGGFDTHIGGGSGYVRTIYDQSGNGCNYGHATASAQPQVVFVGLLPTIVWSSTTGLSPAVTTSTLGLTSGTFAFTTQYKATTTAVQFLYSGGATVYETHLSSATQIRALHTSTCDFTVANLTNNYHTIIDTQIGGNANLRYDGAFIGQQTSTPSTANVSIWWGCRAAAGALSFIGTMSEFIIWSAIPSNTIIALIEADQKTFVSGVITSYQSAPSLALTATFIPPIYSTTAGITTTEGMTVYNSTTKKMNFYNGTAWVAITSV